MKLFFKHTKTVPRSRRPQDSFMHRASHDPYLGWSVLVIGAVIFGGVVIGVGLLTYIKVQNRLTDPMSTNVNARQVLFDDKLMSEILEVFSIRAEEYASLKKGYSGVADPSL
ncbi:MAG: hypothetical protein A3C79_02730 [Candidatus Taylorbacteria bacterium RIFCSPHIGHO2_02_FULL_45_28]|uniref:Uncharacterized protein n=1 Tax=Candidatus Taylorbacteria bacterium RIFCSPHIGHO2_12_FULL_45_16 TaxID=1802315 RepID=A0A1G2N0S8_9BACT|nr:MAG: hypothetical protein A2830_00450 [Candidatus Taylorbacteria bacterium RIFCSPHIGHO2_01_FULL_44_110]OHA24880.1 MAG: hypothetical protein A3C79_02730 [Candidatus Taylorbacteria bacterium RIFCSPHIGHO2_02_FULL_45_28]OHA29698.1 MAG: hypothetical protein A3F51_03145 [Candidatus Taylorbacteria bacterium RIFCSPHIGHO2_12_FULL_45_16]OHA32642.1 MAG: hypothetical protein A3A23_00015 [Candidatus Taylorbacteria bacterium RIFCSPLOWO2_01_FULL_45_59]OHA38795.1 MAG: hypothetical protein A3I98_01450 [Candi